MKRVMLAAVIAVLTVSVVPSSAMAQSCTTLNCDGLPGLPPQFPVQRSYEDFVVQVYIGAYGRFPTCTERRLGHSQLRNAAANGTLLATAKRYVATRFMTATSYNTNDLTTYQQTTAYESRNPAHLEDRAHLESFVTDLYRAFLQREPDAAGHCFWSNDACTMKRKHTIRAFEESIEFGRLVEGLFDGGEPECVIREPWEPCGGGIC
ncbi:MAG TPA: DUF4214 domain-containing protein [Thermoanaerobaculia bacterium]|nr:DUF4214 domain-containing protein [Thermoanaerobaculia bacterium]